MIVGTARIRAKTSDSQTHECKAWLAEVCKHGDLPYRDPRTAL